MLTIAFAHKASGMLATNQVDMLALSAGIARQKDVQLTMSSTKGSVEDV